jgi:hypothetical protein
VTNGPVEAFLAELGRQLRRDDATRERIVAEVGDHLRDLVAEGRARGLDEHGAELDAVDRFGSAREFARGVRPARRGGRTAAVVAAGAVAAVACGAFAFAELRGTTPRGAVPQASRPVHAASDDPNGCRAAILSDPAVQAFSTRIARETTALDRQMLVEIGTRVTLDPSTGRVLSCRAAGANGHNPTVWFLATDAGSPFG